MLEQGTETEQQRRVFGLDLTELFHRGMRSRAASCQQEEEEEIIAQHKLVYRLLQFQRRFSSLRMRSQTCSQGRRSIGYSTITRVQRVAPVTTTLHFQTLDWLGNMPRRGLC
jgi:hypothetical protein